jgi:lysophospholipase L1-like esterase
MLALPLLMLSAAAPTSASADTQPQLSTFLGDSITVGLFATHWSSTYVAQVEQYRPAGSYTSIAAPGATASPDGSPYGPSILDYVPRIPSQSTLVVVEIGTNDLLTGRHDEQFSTDYTALIARVREQAPGAHLLCLGPWEDPAYVNSAGATLTDYDQIVYSACSTHAIDVSNIWARAGTRGPAGRMTDWGPADGFHPNDLGHLWWAAEVLSALASG